MEKASTRSIVVTDSGLGGLSVLSELASRLKKQSPWKSVRLTYVNAWPAPHRGYNHFKTIEQRSRVFNNALDSMRQFDPDQILIACNTLSVIYPHTPFSRTSKMPVQGIIEHGVAMLYEKLAADPQSMAVILGTPTTAMAKTHENALHRMGISKDRIINTGCTNLAGWIERQPHSKEVDRMIETCTKETGEKLRGFSGTAHVGLCCTHFGYKTPLFQKAFDRFVSGKSMVLNPNTRMADKALDCGQATKFSPADIEIKIVSKDEWSPFQINAYFELIPDMAEDVRNALKHYTLNPNLFNTD